jgi:hypothetical protein
LICDDFNALRFRYKKTGLIFKARACVRFNSFVDDFNLVEYELSHRKFTWSNGRQFVLLDRFLCSLHCDSLYLNSVVKNYLSMGQIIVHWYCILAWLLYKPILFLDLIVLDWIMYNLMH